ncbi:related to NF-X1 finger and helicase domain protein [Phialocephala subalpina]|uniref:Related to NF-X1 finger and helicase domain protein n=1 Tax=Phialocephala subalpina TaxID=576137 RepID=A0A1L7XN88_9HELO|nr:related to NF-X1 finger and helicase domain protein [Phialocephala subalpina]
MSTWNATRICFNFARGRCTQGSRCRFSHDSNTPCPDYPTPRGCSRGDRCPYSHHNPTVTTPAASATHSSPPVARQESELEASCRQWTYMIPRPDSRSFRHNSSVDLKKFFETGWELVEGGDAGTRQYIITKLATENGLSMIKAMADLMTDSTRDSSIFQNRTLPFFQIISYPDIISSLILETPLDCIYNFLFGPRGRRAVQVFRYTAAAVASLVTQHSSSNTELPTKATTITLAVLQRLIDGCQTAQVVEDFVPIVETIAACMSDSPAFFPAQQSLVRIRRRLNIGESLPVKEHTQSTIAVHDVAFELDVDMPGKLSNHGPRHDNDCENISDIRILPTAGEIMSQRQEYLPSSRASTHHLTGIAGLLDKHFRLLREDTVGQVRDAVRVELSRLENPNHAGQTSQGKDILRNVVHRNLRLLSLTVDKKKGLQVLVGFDQPTAIREKSRRHREEWWQNTKRLQLDSFVCVVSASRRIIFFSVCEPAGQSSQDRRASDASSSAARAAPSPATNAPSLSQDSDQATVLLSMVEHNAGDVEWIVGHLGARYKSRQSLVEFPGILLPSFQPTLQALQRMSRTLDVPFGDIIAPELQAPDVDAFQSQRQPPAYARRLGFSLNLDCLTGGQPLALKPGSEEPFDFGTFEQHSTLDEAQQEAVVHALKTPLAAIQGPPGTGKSYTGVSIIKALLENREAAKLGPVICVCYTNHALDQLLEHLWQDGVRQIIRLGSRSKSEVLQKLNLHVVSKGIEPTKQEKHDKWQYNQHITSVIQEAETILDGLNNSASWRNVRDYLQLRNPKHFKDLFRGSVDEDGFTEVKEGKKIRVVDSWLRNAPKKLVSNRPVAELQSVSLRETSSLERAALHKDWLEKQSNELLHRLLSSLDELYDSKSNLDKCHQELNLRCLRQANIIGVTTSGLAKTIDVLGRVGAKVVLCEEAGEVLEAHTLTTFLPGVQHAILIGDHQQLRPQINNYELQYDNPRGQRFSLDISLFERLVSPQLGQPKLSCIALETQRRMHPSIAELVRVPLYPKLKDHPSVGHYPEVDGMRKRLYWLDHREKEDPRSAQSVSMSRTNVFEVDMVEALVAHLVRQGTYGNEDIAVLTPYLGQLQKIRKRLASTFAIVVGDRDIEDLEAKGLEDPAEKNEEQQSQKSTLLNALRIATVDNFQGEEAKVIVISLVRSNEERKCGFLKTSNRINVLLSRARHGMFIIGNSDTASPVPMWSQVISILEKSESIGPTLALCCARHQDAPIEVSTPDDFARLSPEGGCDKRCVSRLRCGHACLNMCHSDTLHNAVHCLERCQRTKPGCDHSCPKDCGDRCDDKCQVMVYKTILPCGHIAERLKCHEAQAPETVQCRVQMDHTMPHCDHQVKVFCYQLPLDNDHACFAKCGAMLPCGHTCLSRCCECNIRIDGRIVERTHLPCKTPCSRPYSTCRHNCKASCHEGSDCPLCSQDCEVSCAHSKCSRRCHEPCIPCAEDCSWSCPHHGKCALPCAVPCDLLPCSKRCSNLLSCGHQCPSICGETCPDARYCQVCAKESVKTMVVDYIMSSTYEEIDLDESPCIIPSCGHILTLESMDGHMSMSDFYTSDETGSLVEIAKSSEPFSASSLKNCPQCRGPLRNINRYSRIVRRALIDESTKKFIVWANAGFIPLVSRMEEVEREMREGAQDAKSAPAPSVNVSQSIELTGARETQFTRVGLIVRNAKEYRSVLRLRRDIKHFLTQVDETEQPFGRVRDLVLDARRHKGVNVDDSVELSASDILQTRNRLLTTVLLIRCDYAILVSFLDRYKKASANLTTAPRAIKIDFGANRKDCEALISESKARNQPSITVEGHLYWARFLALERGLKESSDKMTALRETARDHLRQAKEVCATHAGQTKGMMDEIEEVEKMLRDSTFYMPVTNEEKAAVYAAMARDFRGTGHWYYCVNGHPFTVGECGMPMQTSTCPQCGETVGGTNHTAVEGVRQAADLEREFGTLRI